MQIRPGRRFCLRLAAESRPSPSAFNVQPAQITYPDSQNTKHAIWLGANYRLKGDFAICR